MAPECIEVSLELDLESQLMNLLRPLQDLPGFQVKTECKVIKKINNCGHVPIQNKINGKWQSFRIECCDFMKKFSSTIEK